MRGALSLLRLTLVLDVFGTCGILGILMSLLLDQPTETEKRVAQRSQLTPYGLMGCFTNAIIDLVSRYVPESWIQDPLEIG